MSVMEIVRYCQSCGREQNGIKDDNGHWSCGACGQFSVPRERFERMLSNPEVRDAYIKELERETWNEAIEAAAPLADCPCDFPFCGQRKIADAILALKKPEPPT